MRKRFAAFVAVIVIVFCGCAKTPVTSSFPPNGDAFFLLPDGYCFANVTDADCDILNEEGIAVGGIILTDLKPDELEDSDSMALPLYLNQTVYGSSWVENDFESPGRYFSQYFTDDDCEKHALKRILFVNTGVVYDMWFDTALIDENAILAFYPITE